MHTSRPVVVAFLFTVALTGCPVHATRSAATPASTTTSTDLVSGGSAECRAPRPYLIAGACAACRTSADCGAGERCDGGACLAGGEADPAWKVGAEGGQDATCRLAPVHFELDSSAIEGAAAEALQQDAACLARRRAPALLVEGHCDERGGARYNVVLGEQRAAAVKGYLASLGVKTRVDTISFGKEKLEKVGATTEEEHRLNRRAELRLPGERRADGQVYER